MKKLYILLFLPLFTYANQIPPTPFPVFLKAGFSTVLEFEVAPTKVVLGDNQNFQVEKLERSIVIKTLAPYASGNMFVYFKSEDPRLFVLTASEDAEPTYFQKFVSQKPSIKSVSSNAFVQHPSPSVRRGLQILSTKFDSKKDYLTIESLICADALTSIKPKWNLIRITFNGTAIAPNQIWSERKEVQKDSKVKMRLILSKPNIPRDLKNVNLTVPLEDSDSLKISLARGGK